MTTGRVPLSSPTCWAPLLLALVGCLGCFVLGHDRFVTRALPELLGHRTVPFLASFGLASVAAVAGGWEWTRLAHERQQGVRIDRGTYATHVGLAALALLTGTVVTWFAIMVALAASVQENMHGRRLRRFRRVRVPETRTGAWRAPRHHGPDACVMHIDAPDALRGLLAAAWRDAGCKEHAAIASFAQLSLDLLAVGAPPYLLEVTQADGSDEIRHAALCFEIARGFDGEEHAPAAFPAARMLRPLATRSRLLALVQIAVDSLHDGVLNEGMSSRILARLAERAEDPRLAARLRAMAVDEARHASHSWRVVEWCLAEGGETVRRAVQTTAAYLPQRMIADLHPAAAAGHWEHWGLQGKALEQASFERARACAVRKLAELATQTGPAGAPDASG